MRNVKNEVANFTLTDENNNVIDLKGRNMIFTVLMYKRETFFENIYNFMKYLFKKLEK
jgi:hypothetical protein